MTAAWRQHNAATGHADFILDGKPYEGESIFPELEAAMRPQTHFEYRVELHGWRKLWARIRRKPWAWVYEAEVALDPTSRRMDDDGQVAYDFKCVTPLTKRVAS